MTDNEMVGWHHRLNGHEFEQAPGVGDGQRGLAYCGSWGRRESDTTERLNNNRWRCREQSCGHSGGRRGWTESGEQHGKV